MIGISIFASRACRTSHMSYYKAPVGQIPELPCQNMNVMSPRGQLIGGNRGWGIQRVIYSEGTAGAKAWKHKEALV